MSARYVTLGDGRRIGLGAYVAAWARCKQLPGETRVMRCPDGLSGTVGDALRQLRAGMHDRINRHVPGYGVGRKWADGWFWEAKRFSDQINTPRLIVRWAPADFRKRFAERLEESADV